MNPGFPGPHDPRPAPPTSPGQPYAGHPYGNQPYANDPSTNQPYGAPYAGPVATGGPGTPPPDRDRVTVLLVALICVLVVAAVGLGIWIWSASGSSGTASAPVTTTSAAGGQNPLPGGANPPQPPGPPAAGAVQPVGVSATCQADPGTDAAGNPITYEPDLTLDGLLETAWRCPGAAVGQRLEYDFGRPVTITDVGLVPGYAKIDPADGTNRFTENRTVTAVTWQFDDGSTFDQSVAAPQPELAVAELPAPITTSRVVLIIAATGNDAASRDFTAISEVAFAGS